MTVTIAGQRLRIGRSHQRQTVTIAIEDTVYRALIDRSETYTLAGNSAKDITIFKACPRPNST